MLVSIFDCVCACYFKWLKLNEIWLFRVWQHVDCVLESRNNLPEEYLCERCSPRPFNKEAAAALQHMKLAKRIAMASASHLRHSSDSDLSSELGKSVLNILNVYI